MIKNAIAEADQIPDFRVYFMWELGIEVENDITFPQMREDKYQPDYHAGAIETAQMAAFFPEKVRGEVARTLKPQDTFHPFAYCGDPASYELEHHIPEFFSADTKLDALKIEAILKRDGK